MDRHIIFLDVEASSLHRTSYPIEVGWAFLDLRAESFLLRPALEWTAWDWSFESEKIHGISRVECLRSGIEVRDAARRLNEEFAGAALPSTATARASTATGCASSIERPASSPPSICNSGTRSPPSGLPSHSAARTTVW